ncbi:MAG TPA: type II CAAX endopeptidase family protein [Candidatus Saccharimonadales bacterium]|nr:type II CAAX endopeptidase family protein [Candidatus Saccharimonadales bacterium]
MNSDANKMSPSDTDEKIGTVPWNPWLGVVFVFVVFFGSQLFGAILGSIVGAIYPVIEHFSVSQTRDWIENSIPSHFLFVLFAETFTVGAIYLFLKARGLTMAAIGLKRPRWKDVGIGITALPVYFILYLLTVGVVSHFVPGLDVNQQQDVGFNNVHGAGALVLTFISLVVLPPLAEEIMVRGFLYGSLKKALPIIWAALTTSLLFAIAHLPEGGAAGPLYIAALDTFVLSLVLIYLREKTDSLWASITLHAIKNGIAFFAIFVFNIH